MRNHHVNVLKKLEEQGHIRKREYNCKGKRSNTWEEDEQIALVEWFDLVYPDISHFLIAIPNGGSRKNGFEGYRLKRSGVKKGVSDLFLPLKAGLIVGFG